MIFNNKPPQMILRGWVCLWCAEKGPHLMMMAVFVCSSLASLYSLPSIAIRMDTKIPLGRWSTTYLQRRARVQWKLCFVHFSKEDSQVEWLVGYWATNSMFACKFTGKYSITGDYLGLSVDLHDYCACLREVVGGARKSFNNLIFSIFKSPLKGKINF